MSDIENQKRGPLMGIWQKIRLKSLCGGLTFVLAAAGARDAYSQQLTPEMQGTTYGALALEKLSYTMTGLAASEALAPSVIADYRSGTISLSNVADILVTKSAFVERFAQYWLQILKIGSPTSWGDILIPNAPANSVNDVRQPKTLNNIIQFGDYGPTTRRLAFLRDSCNDNGWYRGVLHIRSNATNFPDLNCSADCSRAVMVTPYWDTNDSIKVCQGVLANDHCGPDLSKCLPDIDQIVGTPVRTSHSTFYRDISYGFTMQPGALAGKIVQDNLSWNKMVSGGETVVNGPLAKFINLFNNYFSMITPPGTFPASATDPVFTQSDATKVNDWKWVNAGPKDAGVLTSMAFHRETNGWRAKANRAMNSLLCRVFTVPPGTVQEPSDETDLTKKSYCKTCHQVLEPMSAFFGRWPNVGNDNSYRYDSTQAADGSFNGVSGSDTVAFGNILSNMKDYDECAVIRGFEFITARQMTDDEKAALLRPLTNQFVANGKKLWPIMKTIIESPAFQAQH